MKFPAQKLKQFRTGCSKDRCVACNIPITWKNVQFLSQFVSPWSGRMYERGVTNLCDKAYHKVKHEYKRAIDNGVLGRNYKPTAFMTDPNLSTFNHQNLLSGTDVELPRSSYQREMVDAYVEVLENTTGENAEGDRGSVASSTGGTDTASIKASEGDGKWTMGKSRGSLEKSQKRHAEMQSELSIKRAERKAKRMEEAKANKEKNAPQVVIKDK